MSSEGFCLSVCVVVTLYSQTADAEKTGCSDTLENILANSRLVSKLDASAGESLAGC